MTAVSATSERGRRLAELGAHVVTDVADAKGWFDVALESVGGDLFVAARRRVHPDGMVVWFGQASREPVTLDFFDWVQGTVGPKILPFHYLDHEPAQCRDLATLVRLVDQQRLHPELGVVRPWEDTGKVIADLRARRIRGNAVLEVVR